METPTLEIPEWNETGLHTTEYFRQRKCLTCNHEFVAPVVLSRHTLNLSGEQSVQCPKCDSRSIFSKGMHKVTDYQVRIVLPEMIILNPNNEEAIQEQLNKCEEFLNQLPDLEARFKSTTSMSTRCKRDEKRSGRLKRMRRHTRSGTPRRESGPSRIRRLYCIWTSHP